jgi:GT2 family glycosyltransferase
MSVSPDITVIIPTYNEGDKIARCLDALRQQTFAGSYEVLVVDNGSTRNLPVVPADDPKVCLLQEPKPGSYCARNAGIAQARGRILAFTDSDCLPDKDWLANAWRAFQQDPALALLAGRIDIYFEDAGKPTSVELYERRFAFRQAESVAQGWAVTANLIVRRDVIDAIGPFNTHTFSGGDSEFTQRAVGAGYRLGYGGAVVVQHPARRQLGEINQLRRRHVGGFYRLSRTQPEFASQFSATGIAKDFLYPAKGGLLLLKDIAGGRMGLGEGARILAVLAQTRWYRGLLKLAYKLRLKHDFER